MQEISQKARQVLEYLTQRESSIPPTVREIGAALQIKSTSTVHKYLTELAAAGYIEKGDKMNRAISLPQQQSAKVPLLGVVTAGQPILAVEDIEGYVPYQGGRYPANELFALRVRGESMIEAGILSGDIIIVHRTPAAQNGEIVVALVEDEATVKRFYKESDHIRLQPENSTMDPIITTDCAIDGALLQDMLRQVVTKTFNRITVDGDTSTNDTCVVLANGLAGNPAITGPGEDYDIFFAALRHVCEYEAKMIASDGEGAGRLITCTVMGAETEEQAEQMAKAVVRSPLVKCAVFGTDANWGRVLCAIGYSGAQFDPKDVEVKFLSRAGELLVCAGGQGVAFDEALAKRVLSEDEVVIQVTLTSGSATCSCWGCDLTYDYVKINGDYRT